MSPKLKKFLASWIINTAAVAAAASGLVSGIHYQTWVDLIVASLLLGILNAFIRPVLLLMALPLLIFTLGLFILVINAVLLWVVGQLMTPHFYVDGFKAAFKGAVIIGIISLLLNLLTGRGNSQIKIHRGTRPPGSKSGGGGGPIIDV